MSIAGIQDVVVGMAHRGRLNLLTDLLNYDPVILFHKLKGNAEFDQKEVHSDIVGDVISHLCMCCQEKNLL
jgi:probable 2-oxoglutarate dehydrogenase E1 component DHKTD1